MSGEQVGEEYLGLLPECLPFLAELIEDDVESVAIEAHEWATAIETLTGEKIHSYLS